MKKYFSLYQDADNKTADIYIYGDIVSWDVFDDEISSVTLSKQLQDLDDDTENINIYINSYGGEVKEGLAIYNALKRHKAKVTTVVDGFACSIASVIFAAGDERVMSDTSLLMIHNAWSLAMGDSNSLRKQADDLEKITQASINAYTSISTEDEDIIKQMMDDETWLIADEAEEIGFATSVQQTEEKELITQSVRKKFVQRVTRDPEKELVAQVNIDENQMRKIVKESMDEFKHQLKEQGILEGEEDQQKHKKENKPLNMMRALFNSGEE